MNPAMLETVRTRRLDLVRLQAGDWADYRQLFCDPDAMAHLGGPETVDEVTRRFRRHRAYWSEQGLGPWIARERRTGHFVGMGGLQYIVADSSEEVSVGYVLVPAYWHMGFAQEIASKACDIGFLYLDRDSLVAITQPDNLASLRVMDKLGFRYERKLHDADSTVLLYRLHGAAWKPRA